MYKSYINLTVYFNNVRYYYNIDFIKKKKTKKKKRLQLYLKIMN